ncbi:MAG: peptidoglycan DD-metalloendopeptidase family protein [Chitinophagaceae bacterium]
MFQSKKKPSHLLLSGSVISQPVAEKNSLSVIVSVYKKKVLLYILLLTVLALPVVILLFRPAEHVYFRYPLNISPELAASFGEVRDNHFHMGLDLRTKGRENFPVYAIADGFISRVQISENGFGKAVYVTHPNGTTSVYAHLRRFNDELEVFVHKQQYAQEKWEQDIRFKAGDFPINKGSLIALSGNTGTSEGPHLHIEIHNTKTNNSINPQIAGFSIRDNIAPVINSIYWYNKSNSIYQSNGNKLLLIKTSSIDQPLEIAAPRIVLGIEATDKNALTRFQLGIYKASLYMDDMLMHRFTMDELSEADTRYVNACIDYKEYNRSGKTIQLLTSLPGNHNTMFSRSSADGVLDIHDGRVHHVAIVIADAAGNTTTEDFYIRYTGAQSYINNYPAGTLFIIPGKDTTLRYGQSVVHFDKTTFFDIAPLLLKEEQLQGKDAISVRLHLFPETIPIYDSIQVSLATTLQQLDSLRKHTVIQFKNRSGRYIVKGIWHKNSMTGYLPQMGAVQLIVDTTAPVIKVENPSVVRFSPEDSYIRIVCKDNLGFIADFRGTIDGHWVAFEKKGNVFTYQPDSYCKTGPHTVSITVADIAGNTATKSFTIIR